MIRTPPPDAPASYAAIANRRAEAIRLARSERRQRVTRAAWAQLRERYQRYVSTTASAMARSGIT